MIDDTNIHLINIPAGKIILHDDRIQKTWEEKLDTFLICKYPVSQELYQDVMGVNPSLFANKNHPVETVSWLDAITFLNKLSLKNELKPVYIIEKDSVRVDHSTKGYRLPTEAEWEYACRGSIDAIRYGELDEIAWYKLNSNQSTQPVGLKKPNSFGLYDMLGNVWEWCEDIYDEAVYGSYRVFKGGGWCDEERGVMATNRRRSHPKAFKIDDLGFRIAKSI